VDRSRKILKRLESLHPKKIDLSLNRLKDLLKKLGNPHLNVSPIIHIAGTNGKGSVTAFLRSILENSNFKTHVYTSPHLTRFNERIRLNSKLIDDEFLNKLLEECEYYNKGNQITFFEITTAAAFLAFSRVKSDFILLETGLGGRFDATNVIKKSLCSVLTPISIDHTNLLGNSIKQITKEKLGIFKENSMAIISKQTELVKKLIKTEADKKKVVLFQESKEWNVIEKKLKKKEFIFNYLGKKINFPIPKLYGDHQIENASTAIATILSLKNINIDKNSISLGVLNAEWPARMHNLNKGKLSKIVKKKFDIWLDGGHNFHASEMISKVLDSWGRKNIFLILGMMNGKNPVEFISKLIKKISAVVLIPISDHICIKPEKIKKDITENFKNKIDVVCQRNISEALFYISKKYREGKVLICGSLYLAGEILEEDGFKIN